MVSTHVQQHHDLRYYGIAVHCLWSLRQVVHTYMHYRVCIIYSFGYVALKREYDFVDSS